MLTRGREFFAPPFGLLLALQKSAIEREQMDGAGHLIGQCGEDQSFVISEYSGIVSFEIQHTEDPPARADRHRHFSDDGGIDHGVIRLAAHIRHKNHFAAAKTTPDDAVGYRPLLAAITDLRRRAAVRHHFQVIAQITFQQDRRFKCIETLAEKLQNMGEQCIEIGGFERTARKFRYHAQQFALPAQFLDPTRRSDRAGDMAGDNFDQGEILVEVVLAQAFHIQYGEQLATMDDRHAKLGLTARQGMHKVAMARGVANQHGLAGGGDFTDHTAAKWPRVARFNLGRQTRVHRLADKPIAGAIDRHQCHEIPAEVSADRLGDACHHRPRIEVFGADLHQFRKNRKGKHGRAGSGRGRGHWPSVVSAVAEDTLQSLTAMQSGSMRQRDVQHRSGGGLAARQACVFGTRTGTALAVPNPVRGSLAPNRSRPAMPVYNVGLPDERECPMATPIEVKVPDIGNYQDIPVIELLVKPGDTVKKDQGLVSLESDKATMEVPAPVAGIIRSLLVKLGDTLSEGSLVATLEPAEAAAAAPSAPAKAAPAPSPAPAVVPSAAAAPEVAAPRPDAEAFVAKPPVSGSPLAAEVPLHASPAVRLFARELGVDLTRISEGTGRKNRLTKEDVQNFVKRSLAAGPASNAAGASGDGGLRLLPWPKVDFSKFGATESRALSRIKKISGANLARNWAMIPHVTQNDEADITEMEGFRKKLGEENKDLKITPLVFLIRACVAALKKFPSFNASLDASGENLILKKYFHIGIAVDTPDGLVVPVIRDCDQKGLVDLARELGEISLKARDKKLGPTDMQGGCFSISSLGGIGGTGFTPIINAPEVAILGVSKSAMKPFWNGKEFAPRLMLPLSLSYDHRVVDGAEAARFAAYLAQMLGDIRRLLL